MLARKPLSERNVAANVLRHGTGAINVDACRIGTDGGCAGAGRGPRGDVYGDGLNGSFAQPVPGLGRWPANVALDAEAAAMLDEQSGERPGFATQRDLAPTDSHGVVYPRKGKPPGWREGYGDTGGASRFFYTAKADTAERLGGNRSRSAHEHPTVKPVDLMAWLLKMVTPPGGIVLDPFLGSGSTALAAQGLGIAWVGIEQSAEYAAIAQQRIGMFCELVEAPPCPT